MVKGAALPDSATSFKQLTAHALLQTLASLDEQGKVVAYADATDTFARWGYYRGRDYPLSVPIIACEKLLQDWGDWQESLVDVIPILRQMFESNKAGLTDDNLKRLCFLNLAAAIWQEALAVGFIKAGPFATGFLRFLGMGKPVEHFSGVLLLQGDHHSLWEHIGLSK